ncbi:unnamed protein product [Rhizoctonia solani]|uniref:Uncharacterized protein n=1 Tax=Rhizoctonia solani TaxID=456999 RepID=A0A8H3GK18_9AGAM|nr:unnamed protein product [Rhizoctonia solani]
MRTPPHLEGLSLTVLGHPRGTPIKHPITRAAVAGGREFKRIIAHLLFRRVRPVETRLYAAARNSFAIVAMGILCFRTITALLQAQNEIGSRMTSAACDGRASPSHNISILMERPISDSRWNASSLEGIDINVTASWRHSRRGYGTFELFGCPSHWTGGFKNYHQLLERSPNSDIIVYHIEVRPRVPGGQILYDQMPFVWLVNSMEIPSNFTDMYETTFQVRDFTPPWELLRGSHIEAEAKLITRRFISSSIMKDVVLNSEPVYRPLSLYPIVESSVVALNSSGASGASATISASLTPGLMYLRNQADVRSSSNVCDFIDDYRSRGFKRRLKEEYHSRSTEGGSETIQIVKFLRDFVIEFGPADLDTENHPLQQTDRHSSLSNEEVVAGTQIPLMRMDSDKPRISQNELKAGEIV